MLKRGPARTIVCREIVAWETKGCTVRDKSIDIDFILGVVNADTT